MIVIDAKKSLGGGARSFIVNRLQNSNLAIVKENKKVILFAPSSTNELIDDYPFLEKVDSDFFSWWERLLHSVQIFGLDSPNIDHVVCVAGLILRKKYKTTYIHQNSLPFSDSAISSYPLGWYTLRFYLLRWYALISMLQASQIIFFSFSARDLTVDSCSKLKKKPFRILRFGAGSIGMPKPNSRPIGTYKVIYVSGLDHYKNHSVVLDEIMKLNAKFLGRLKVDFYGNFGSAYKHIKKKIDSNDMLARLVTLHGEVSQKEVLNAIAQSDLGIFASRCEAFPNVVIEQIELGLPLICVKLDSIEEVFGDSLYYFEPERSGDLSRKLSAIFADSSLLRRIKLQQNNAMAKILCWDTVSREYWEFILKKGHE